MILPASWCPTSRPARSGALDVSDAVSILLLLFGGDNQPPGPPVCDEDATEDPLDCGAFASCAG